MDLRGKSALLTGASKGLGRELARTLDARGCRLLLVARDAALLNDLRGGLRVPGTRALPADLCDPAARAALVAQITAGEPRLDLLIHCAGAGSHSRLDQLSAAETNQLLQLNAVAPLELTAALRPLLPPGQPGGVVSIGSVAGELALPGMSLYSATKAALHSFARAAAVELAADGHFSLLVVLGPLRGTRFEESIRHPAAGQPGWYRRLDVDAAAAARRVVRAIAQERARVTIPAWYAPVIFLGRLFGPVTRRAAARAYRRYR